MDRIAIGPVSLAVEQWPLVVVPGTNHYTVLLGQNPKVKTALRAFLREK
jgi:hypothetical protein